MTTQVGGTHYQDFEIQPWEFNLRNRIGWCEGEVVKYVTRWQNKNGIDDLRKAKSILEYMIDHVDSTSIDKSKKNPGQLSGGIVNCATKHRPLVDYQLTDHEAVGLD